MDKHQQPHFAGMAQIETGRPHNPPVLILAGAPREPIHRPLDGGVLMDADRHDRLTPSEILDLEILTDPFSLTLFWLDCWKIYHDDCPGLATLLDTIDHAGIGRSFDLKFWLRAWRRA